MSQKVIVIGLGCAGSAACACLASRGASVIGLEQFNIGHERGSSAHQSRAFRMAYAEHPGYVPLLKHARELWLSIDEGFAKTVFHQTGGLYLSNSEGGFVPDSIAAANAHDVPHDVLTAKEVRSRFPVFDIPDEFLGLHEPLAGFIVPEYAIEAHITIARAHGADLREGVQVLGWEETVNGVEVETDQGSVVGDSLVICKGAWMNEVPLRPSRQVLVWLDSPKRAGVDSPDLPVWALELEDSAVLYGFPRTTGLPGPTGFKVARHIAGDTIDPDDEIAKAVVDGDEMDVLPHLQRWLSSAIGEVNAVRTCMYANSPDGHFRIGLHPGCAKVTIIAGLSGHGFKFQPVIGEIAADLALNGSCKFDISFLGLK